MTKPALAYEPHVLTPRKNPASRFARLGVATALQPRRPLAYEVRDGVPLLDLEPHMCRWPVGTPGAALHCGHDKAPGRAPYCAAHAKASRQTVTDPLEVDRFVRMCLRFVRADARKA